jgi:hypothetical protein
MFVYQVIVVCFYLIFRAELYNLKILANVKRA